MSGLEPRVVGNHSRAVLLGSVLSWAGLCWAGLSWAGLCWALSCPLLGPPVLLSLGLGVPSTQSDL